MSRLIVGPFNRVEGDLEVRLEVSAGQVADAWVNCTLYRGFERMLGGKQPDEALVLTPRICGICSVSQSAAAARALESLQGLSPPANGQRLANLVLACENLADHLTHFYLFFMPDFARACYRQKPWYPEMAARFQAIKGSAAAQAIPARAAFLNLMGLLAGKWPHTLAIQPGGSSRPVQAQERLRLLAILAQFREFLETHTFGDRLESVLALDDTGALERWRGRHLKSDFGRFLTLSRELELAGLGRASDRFMSYGSYPDETGLTLASGVWDQGLQALDLDAVREDVSHSWMEAEPPRSPREGRTRPDPHRDQGYSWCKAPRLGGQVLEVGALARQLVDGQPLARDLVKEAGGNVHSRVVMRLIELARTLSTMETWARQLEPGAPCFNAPGAWKDGSALGCIEAARGSLGHWIEVAEGRIRNYQIVAPTTWNFSPRDASGQPGALEQALRGTPVAAGEEDPVAVQHVVRSFDPCMVCTVH